MRTLCLSLVILSGVFSTSWASGQVGLEFTRTVYIGAPAEKVWDALVNPKTVNQYYLAPLHKIELKKDGKIEYGFPKQIMISGKVTEAVTNKKLSHTFKFAHRPTEPESHVTYSIQSMGKMSELRLKHDGFTVPTGTYADVSAGWDSILSSLKTLLETGKPLPWPKPERK